MSIKKDLLKHKSDYTSQFKYTTFPKEREEKMKKRRLKSWVKDLIGAIIVGIIFALNLFAIYINYFK